MSRKGNCWDNAPQESFYGHMKAEISDLVAGCSVYEEVKVIVDDWMDYFGFQEADTEKAVHLHCLPQTRYGARVAPQRCTILRIGKTTIGYHRRGSLTPQRIKIVLEKGYTS